MLNIFILNLHAANLSATKMILQTFLIPQYDVHMCPSIHDLNLKKLLPRSCIYNACSTDGTPVHSLCINETNWTALVGS